MNIGILEEWIEPWKQNNPDKEDARGTCANEANLINKLCEELINFSLREKL